MIYILIGVGLGIFLGQEYPSFPNVKKYFVSHCTKNTTEEEKPNIENQPTTPMTGSMSVSVPK